jgi:hypothetical protein
VFIRTPVAPYPQSSGWLDLGADPATGGTGEASAQQTFTGIAKGSCQFNLVIGYGYIGYNNTTIILQDATSQGGDVGYNAIELAFFYSGSGTSEYYISTVASGVSVNSSVISNGEHLIKVSWQFSSTAEPEGYIQVYADGEMIVNYSGTLNSPDGSNKIVGFYIANGYATNCAIDNLYILDESAGIYLDSARASYGQRVSLSGSFTSGYDPTALQYEVGSSGTWASVLTFAQVGDTWTGYGPIANSFTPQTLTVRDASNTSVISNTLTFEAQNGVFVWNDVTIN